MTKQRILILLLAVTGGLLAACLMYFIEKSASSKSQTQSGLMAVSQDAFGGPFTLSDHNNVTVTEKDFTGKYRLIYFGFTYCPAICPTELSKITSVLNTLGDKGKAIQPVFVTVDPERDTPEKMKNYVSLFHPSLIGLTGTPEQVKSMLKTYKIYAAKVQDETMSDYTMDHSSFIYFMDPDDRLLHIFKISDKADDMTAIISEWLDQNPRP